VRWHEDPAKVRPMLATALDPSAKIPLQDAALWYEPKYDGIRALVAIDPGRPVPQVRLWSRNGNEKTTQFPDLVKALQEMARDLRMPLVLDGEIVALDAHGEPAGFQRLQGRMHLTDAREIVRQTHEQAVAILLFDILREGADDVRPLPLGDRRARLERILEPVRSSAVRIGEFAAGDGRRLYEQAVAKGWEGLLVKAADSVYDSGRRSHAWRKLKLLKQQEFVVCGWTEPRNTRAYFGALLLGAYVSNGAKGAKGTTRELRHVGHTGTGFTQHELQRVYKLLEKLKTDTCPFPVRPVTNERPQWVRPELVAQVRFSEWTVEGLLRHPVYLGMRDDIDPRNVTIEPSSAPPPGIQVGSGSSQATATRSVPARAASPIASATSRAGAIVSKSPRSSARASAVDSREADQPKPAKTAARVTKGRSGSSSSRTSAAGRNADASSPSAAGGRKRAGGKGKGIAPDAKTRDALRTIVDHLRALEDARRDGTLVLLDGSTLDVTNLAKVFWPDERLTKGDLLRYYVQISPWLLSVVADRPLVMRRFPNGIKAKAFYQQRAPDDVPKGVRVVEVPDEGEETGVMPRLIGGSLQTLLYMTQLAAISQDPWFSRVQSTEYADYVALDLDPMPGVPFSQVLDVARAVHEELDTLGIPACPKTSGASGLHVYIPLPPETTYETGQLLCHVVAAIVSSKHRRIATIERAVAKRGRTVYVDYLQNIEGKTLATAYSARASEFAGVSTPLTWDEVYDGLAPQDFTLRTAIARFEQTGDLWSDVISGTSVDLGAVLTRLAKFAV
jgi:bifunctional non-homologous end joining protein LigD